MNQKLRNLVCVFSILTIFFGCKEDPTEPENSKPSYLFKATFTNDWLPQDEHAVIFLSDNNGNILADTIWIGNDSFEMFLDENFDMKFAINLTHINITTVTEDNITTNLNIPTGSSWTFKGYPSVDYDNPPFSVEIDFDNIPEYEDYYVISSKWNSRASTSVSLDFPLDFNFYESPMDIYFKLNTVNDGVKYLWLNNTTNESRKEDLSNMNSAISKSISLPNNVGYRKYLYGFSNPGHRYEGSYRLDYGRDYNSSVNQINVSYPEQTFTDYRTSITVIDELYSKEWYSSVYGEIPNSFSKIGAIFYYVNTSIDDFEITTSGDYLQTLSVWHTENYSCVWDVYGDKDGTKYSLPNFPNSVSQLFNIERTSFQLWYADIKDYPELSSYSEIIKTVFKSDKYFYDTVNEVRSYTVYAPNGLSKMPIQKKESRYERQDPNL